MLRVRSCWERICLVFRQALFCEREAQTVSFHSWHDIPYRGLFERLISVAYNIALRPSRQWYRSVACDTPVPR